MRQATASSPDLGSIVGSWVNRQCQCVCLMYLLDLICLMCLVVSLMIAVSHQAWEHFYHCTDSDSLSIKFLWMPINFVSLKILSTSLPSTGCNLKYEGIYLQTSSIGLTPNGNKVDHSIQPWWLPPRPNSVNPTSYHQDVSLTIACLLCHHLSPHGAESDQWLCEPAAISMSAWLNLYLGHVCLVKLVLGTCVLG